MFSRCSTHAPQAGRYNQLQLTVFLCLTLDVISAMRYYHFHDKILPGQGDRKNIQQAILKQIAAKYSSYCTQETGNS